ncbi:DUF6010 family protein [Sphingobacterium oryzagri]|uniref:DUF6010 family protein n=1 Tax=Sphingobacterium oryzagri TaxID=3025669 RepID=A0ABY7WCP4_9SPHI|nr:DUF6010 family protein [Sphingobacterium sp. KACC 22765]WDF66968.1 DUF6010 family protein [Sphingobacterium sp. KACC 22765]
MNTHQHIVPEFTSVGALAAVIIAIVFIAIMSCIREPFRQKINALLIAGAGAVYWSGGLGAWEFVFSTIMLFIAFKGLKHYYFIGIGWLLHTGWDILHHLYADPIVYFEPSSSAGCAVCDPIIAIWFFLGAPSIWNLFNKPQTIPS